ncbi:putative galacturan 1,4-alpha-galacturonidase SALK6 isoform X2 [Tasmannia lanceolata]|uniref:putative galacturan 1,4-alpha-galacturonidase SALK6 isoform X2 n=1 Tax=Tasmannia lanceolata TaxID=3420 RepID=UPI00406353C4
MLDGQGAAEAWLKPTCQSGGKCKFMPVSLRFIGNNNGKIQNINFQNSKSFLLVINNCIGVDISGVHVTAPEDSPNNDGIHISGSSHVHVTNCQIGVGDDCVSIGDGNTDISIEGVTCGPGHGISVGSLGKYARETGVTGVHVKNCVLTGTTNGVRIKTWNRSPTLKASNFTFEDITMNKSNPISLSEVSAAVSVLLGFAPPPPLPVESSSKLDEVLLPNPFDRPRAVLMLEVKGVKDPSLFIDNSNSQVSSALRTKILLSSSKAEIQLPDEDEVSLVLLDEPAN